MPKKMYLKVGKTAKDTIFLINGEDVHTRALTLDMRIGEPIAVTAEMLVYQEKKNLYEFTEVKGYLFSEEEYEEYQTLKALGAISHISEIGDKKGDERL